MKLKIKFKSQNGITLIALVITIVVLLILAGVSINAMFSENGIIKRAKEAQNKINQAVENDQKAMDELGNWLDSKINEATTGPKVTINGSTVVLTKANVHRYLGKKVTNYTGQSSVNIGDTEYIVSPEYRLYYIDFDNKYGDGEGTIYLKAENVSYSYKLPITDTSPDTDTNIKIKALNPSLYASGVTAPTTDNMKAVTWLTNTTNWANLADTTKTSDINYIVGGPSLELMMDSYNTYYQLTESTPYTGAITVGERKRLFYKYTSGEQGYRVGPSANSNAENGYYYYTSENSVYADSAIGSMYYPGETLYYWLASPSATNGCIMGMSSHDGGLVGRDGYNNTRAFCPVVSLKANVQLQLQ